MQFQKLILILALGAGSSTLHADTIAVTYSLSGAAQDVVMNGGFLDWTDVASGFVNQIAVSFTSTNHANLATGQNNGTFTLTFPAGDTLFGTLFEVAVLDPLTLTGPSTETLTFTGGTGLFANATGSASGTGTVSFPNFTTSGTGNLSVSPIPEPGSMGLLLGGLGVILVAGRRRFGRRTALLRRAGIAEIRD